MSTYYHENCNGEVAGVNSETQTPSCTKCGQSGEAEVKSRLDGTMFVFFRTQQEIHDMDGVVETLDDWEKRGLI